MGYAASSTDTNAQAPYRWNSNDPQAAAVNTAEVIGKQLVGKKAEFGGDGVKNETRKFGAVYVEDGIDYSGFTDYFAKFGGKITNSGSFASAALADPTEVQTEAATMMAKMKDTGVTTMVMFVGYPQFGPLMESEAEISLARSAAPASISGGAEVLVLGRHGYETAVRGKNGFVCVVERSWTELDTPAPPAVPRLRSIPQLVLGHGRWQRNARLTTGRVVAAAASRLRARTSRRRRSSRASSRPATRSGQRRQRQQPGGLRQGPRLPYNER
jgi:hypothetical protein